MADHMRTELVADALGMAVATRGGSVDGVIFHSDRGSQYLSGEYQDLVRANGIRQSVGRTVVCWDNSVAESFWSSLKRELVHRYRFRTRAEARRAIFVWINRYNTSRAFTPALAISRPPNGRPTTVRYRHSKPRKPRVPPAGGSSGLGRSGVG